MHDEKTPGTGGARSHYLQCPRTDVLTTRPPGLPPPSPPPPPHTHTHTHTLTRTRTRTRTRAHAHTHTHLKVVESEIGSPFAVVILLLLLSEDNTSVLPLGRFEQVQPVWRRARRSQGPARRQAWRAPRVQSMHDRLGGGRAARTVGRGAVETGASEGEGGRRRLGVSVGSERSGMGTGRDSLAPAVAGTGGSVGVATVPASGVEVAKPRRPCVSRGDSCVGTFGRSGPPQQRGGGRGGLLVRFNWRT